jgi:hypothetical protein
MRTWGLVTTVAILLMPQPSWGHRFPAHTTVVAQVDDCGVSLLIGWRPASGLPTELLIGQATSTGKVRQADALQQQLSAMALSNVQLIVDGKTLQPGQIDAFVTAEEGSLRPTVLLLANFAVAKSGTVQIKVKDPKTSRISWLDKSSGRVEISQSPAQQKWFDQVASLLLYVSAANQLGDAKCSIVSSLPPSPLSLSAPVPLSAPAAITNTKKMTPAIHRRPK